MKKLLTACLIAGLFALPALADEKLPIKIGDINVGTRPPNGPSPTKTALLWP